LQCVAAFGVMAHIWMSHVTRMHESCHTHEWVMAHICMSHVTHTNEACPTYVRMSHVTHLRKRRGGWRIQEWSEVTYVRKNIRTNESRHTPQKKGGRLTHPRVKRGRARSIQIPKRRCIYIYPYMYICTYICTSYIYMHIHLYTFLYRYICMYIMQISQKCILQISQKSALSSCKVANHAASSLLRSQTCRVFTISSARSANFSKVSCIVSFIVILYSTWSCWLTFENFYLSCFVH